MDKTKFHLGQEVTVGGEPGVIDALTQSCVAAWVGDRYVIAGWEEIGYVGA